VTKITASAENEVSGGDAVALVGVPVGLSDGAISDACVEQAVSARVASEAVRIFKGCIIAIYSLDTSETNFA
jgi:hypothetical protein